MADGNSQLFGEAGSGGIEVFEVSGKHVYCRIISIIDGQIMSFEASNKNVRRRILNVRLTIEHKHDLSSMFIGSSLPMSNNNDKLYSCGN